MKCFPELDMRVLREVQGEESYTVNDATISVKAQGSNSLSFQAYSSFSCILNEKSYW